MIELTIYLKDAAGLRAVAERLEGLQDVSRPSTSSSPAGAHDEPEPQPRSVAGGAARAARSDAHAPPLDEPPPNLSRQEVSEALQDYARANGAGALKELLDRFGARRVSDLEPERYAEVLASVKGEPG